MELISINFFTTLYCFRGIRDAGAYPEHCWVKVGHTLDGSPACHNTLTITPSYNPPLLKYKESVACLFVLRAGFINDTKCVTMDAELTFSQGGRSWPVSLPQSGLSGVPQLFPAPGSAAPLRSVPLRPLLRPHLPDCMLGRAQAGVCSHQEERQGSQRICPVRAKVTSLILILTAQWWRTNQFKQTGGETEHVTQPVFQYHRHQNKD